MAHDGPDGGPPGVEGAASMWERPEVAARFAARPPDRRLQALFAGEGVLGPVLEAWRGTPPTAEAPDSRRPPEAHAPTVLDVGCAGGRNSVWLAEQGADVVAVDASAAMVAVTRERLAATLGAEEATRRVVRRGMRDLSPFQDGAFDLVVALGVLQDAEDRREWDEALDEVARVLREGGLCLVANFGPDSRPHGVPLVPVPDEPFTWTGFAGDGRRMTLPDLERLDAAFAARGLRPAVPTERVRVATPVGYRITINALYRKDSAPPT